MNEQQWLLSSDPSAMLRHLTHGSEPMNLPAGRCVEQRDRKLRLFAVACCRQVWDGAGCPTCDGDAMVQLRQPPGWIRVECHDCNGSGRIGGLTDPRSRRAVETAERYADGGCNEAELLGAAKGAGNARRESGATPFDAGHDQKADMLLLAAANCCQPPAYGAAVEVSRLIQQHTPPAFQASLLRDVFGSPFRPASLLVQRAGLCAACAVGKHDHCGGQVSAAGIRCGCQVCWGTSHSWLAWNDGCVAKLAQSIYAERRFADMPLLADALSEAGCEDAAILAHCRGRQRCGCEEGKAWVNQRLGFNQPPSKILVEHGPCDGTGWVDAGPHVRGCWVLDLLLGKE